MDSSAPACLGITKCRHGAPLQRPLFCASDTPSVCRSSPLDNTTNLQFCTSFGRGMESGGASGVTLKGLVNQTKSVAQEARYRASPLLSLGRRSSRLCWSIGSRIRRRRMKLRLRCAVAAAPGPQLQACPRRLGASLQPARPAFARRLSCERWHAVSAPTVAISDRRRTPKRHLARTSPVGRPKW